jgi:hypothetical protein
MALRFRSKFGSSIAHAPALAMSMEDNGEFIGPIYLGLSKIGGRERYFTTRFLSH